MSELKNFFAFFYKYNINESYLKKDGEGGLGGEDSVGESSTIHADNYII